jgi:hypothetical protein
MDRLRLRGRISTPWYQSAFFTIGTASYPGVKRSGCGTNHQSSSRTKLKEVANVRLSQQNRKWKQYVLERKEICYRTRSFELWRKCRWQYVTSVEIISYKLHIVFEMSLSMWRHREELNCVVGLFVLIEYIFVPQQIFQVERMFNFVDVQFNVM